VTRRLATLIGGIGLAMIGVVGLTAVVIALIAGGDDKRRGGLVSEVAVEPDVIPTPPLPKEPRRRKRRGTRPQPSPTPAPTYSPIIDPFGYDPAKRKEFEARAAAGNAHILYALSPGGALATAKRVARFRPQIERAAEEAGVSADRLEALVFLESAGRPDVISPQGIAGAVGLTQIVASTGTGLLAMPIDVERSIELTSKIAIEPRPAKRRKLIAKRKRADPRFDVRKELAASGRYLATAEKQFESEELAFVSYHMGIGNLQGVLDAYGGTVPYTQVYFDSSPTRHPEAWQRLFDFNDDSSRYLFKLNAAQQIMAAYRIDPADLAEQAALQTASDSAEQVLHPPAATPVFERREDIAAAYDDGDLVPLALDVRATGVRVDPRLRPRLYRGLRPEAAATLLYIGARVRAGSGGPHSFLTLGGAVREGGFPDLHATGYAFDILRRYRSDQQARAFQAVLDRLQSLNLIAYIYEDRAIHITVSKDAIAFKPLLDRVR
jgi:hypothetical protein